MSFLEWPSKGSIFYAVEGPAFGGDALSASQSAAFEVLSPGSRRTLEGLNSAHSASREYSPAGQSAQKRKSMAVAEAEGRGGEFVHPMGAGPLGNGPQGALGQSGFH